MANFPLNDGTCIIRSSYPYTELWDLLVEKTLEVGHVLTFDEARKDPKFIDPNSYAFSLGGRFSDWAKKAWHYVETWREDDMRRSTNREQIIKDLKTFYEAYGRLPTQTELDAESDLPCYGSVRLRLGPKSTWLKQLYGNEKPLVISETAKGIALNDAPLDTQLTMKQSESTKSGTEIEPSLGVELPSETGQHFKAEPLVEVKTYAEGTSSQPLAEVTIVDQSSQTTQENNNVTIELKISLPNRKTPIIVNLSF